MTKKILGLDLGTTSIGWAYVTEDENDSTKSSIIEIGVRVNPLTTEEQTNFEKGKPVSVNAERTLKRGARKTLDRYQLRRSNLIDALRTAGLITFDSVLAEDGKGTTHSTYSFRARAVVEEITKAQLARVLLAINKKRGYKSSRKAKNEDEGQAIDGMAIAKRLYEGKLTPGQLAYQLLQDGKKTMPDFYRSDLQAEFDRIFDFQRQFHPEIFTDEFKKDLEGKGQRATSALFWIKYGFNTAENKAKSRQEKKLQAYKWRNDAISQKLEKEEAAYVLTEINSNLNNSSGYLGAISDRSKELYFNKETVGQNLYKQLQQNPHTKLKNQVFYRQDYLDEFEAIWKEQSKHHAELTDALKVEIRDITIFYQRKLKSQKGLISFCELESREIEIEKNGQKTKKTIGLKVAPKSSPLFQEFKMWQRLGDVLIRKKGNKKPSVKKSDGHGSLFEEKEDFILDLETKHKLFEELNLKGNINASKIISLLGYTSQEWEMNFTELEGNRTNEALYGAFLKILDIEGYDIKDLFKVKSNKNEVNLEDIDAGAAEIKNLVTQIFETLNVDTSILAFDATLDGKLFEQQASYKLWHLLYSYEGDDSASGNEKLYELLEKKFGFKKEHAQILANVTLSDDYGSLSSRAMRKIYPHIIENNYSTACKLVGYNHSALSLTKEEIATRPLTGKLELLKKNSLRNPVVEKILNQLVNVVNTLVEKNSTKNEEGNIIKHFEFDEIRIELARDLKKNAAERAEMTANINEAKIKHDKIFKILQAEFGVRNPTRTDIIRYKLYEELKNNGYKDLYTNTYIPREILFSKQIDIDHIIPQAKLFDDSFSNKTVVFRKDNLDKSNKTANDFIDSKYGEQAFGEFKQRIDYLFEQGKKNKEEGINKAKYQKLLKTESEIGDGFIERDLRDTQYIAKKAKNMLYAITRNVVSTTGSITNRLREDWDLINIMQELNFDKFKKLGLTEMVEKKDGSFKERIVDWSKRNDHRHHAMDALTVAFTKHNHIQYLNYLNARKNEGHKLHDSIISIEAIETDLIIDKDGNKKRKFRLPLLHFRQAAKEHLENVLVSHKAKNKVVTKNKNKIAGKEKPQIALTPRGQLHKETVYGKYQYYESKEEKISAKFDLETIEKVANAAYKELLLQRLSENGNDPVKAFAGKNTISKNPIYLNKAQIEKLPEIVKLVWLEENYSIRKDVTPENFKDEKTIEKVLDKAVKEILLKRLKDKYGDPKKAFSDLDKNPIWLNEAKGIAVKRVTISGVKNAEPLHHKKDHLGKDILNKDGKRIAVDFVSTGNNHHVAIYKDEKGDFQEQIVSLFEAVQLVNAGEPVIDKTYNQGLGWQFLFTMKQNEYFVFANEKTDFTPQKVNLLDPKNRKLISPNLFRVQKISTKNYMFTNHTETKAIDGDTLKNNKELSGVTYHFIQTPSNLKSIVKVRLNHLGEIIKVGEY